VEHYRPEKLITREEYERKRKRSEQEKREIARRKRHMLEERARMKREIEMGKHKERHTAEDWEKLDKKKKRRRI